MNNTESNIDKIFELLDSWRNLPSYQLERRADIYFALYLPYLINKKFGVTVEHMIPEFPVRIGTIYENKQLKNPNLSFKIDYVVVCKSNKSIYFIELKTDNNSRRDKQDWYLEQAQKIGIKKLIDGIFDIYKATSSKKKYNNLLNLLSEIGFLNKDNKTNTCTDFKIEVLYIQPETDQSGKNIITFDEIAFQLKDESDYLSKRFVKSLISWKTNPNF